MFFSVYEFDLGSENAADSDFAIQDIFRSEMKLIEFKNELQNFTSE